MTSDPTPSRSIRTSAAFTVGSNLLQFGIQFVASVIIARLLSPDEMGVFAISMAAYGLVFAFQNTGVIQFLVSQEELTPRMMGTVISMTALQAIAFAACLILISFGVAWMLGDARIVPAVSMLSISALLTPSQQISLGLLRRAMRFDWLFVLNIASSIATAGVSVGAAMSGSSYLSLALGSIAGALTASLVGVALCYRQLRVRPNLDLWRDYWRFGRSMLSIVTISNLCSRPSVFLLGLFNNVAAVGYYSRGDGIVDMVQFGILDPLGQLVLPKLAEQRRRGESYSNTYLRAASAITAVSWASFAGLAVLCEPLISLIYGPTWLPAAPALVWLCVARMVGDLLCRPMEIMVASDRLHLVPRVQLVKSVGGLAAFSLGAVFGLQWAAAGRVAESALAVFLFLPLIKSAAQVSIGDLVPVWRTNAIAAVAAILPSVAFMSLWGWPTELPIFALVSLVVAGVLAWLIVLFTFEHEISSQIRPVLHRLGVDFLHRL